MERGGDSRIVQITVENNFGVGCCMGQTLGCIFQISWMVHEPGKNQQNGLKNCVLSACLRIFLEVKINGHDFKKK